MAIQTAKGYSTSKNKKLPLMTKESEELLRLINEGLTTGEGPFAEIFGKFNEQDFQKGVADPAIKNFQDNILPQIQEQFIAGNQALGSGMRRGVLKGGNDLQSQLAQLMYQAKQQHKQNQLTGAGLSIGAHPHENLYTQKQEVNPWAQLLPVAGTVVGGLVGGPPGAAAGNALGQGAAATTKAIAG